MNFTFFLFVLANFIIATVLVSARSARFAPPDEDDSESFRPHYRRLPKLPSYLVVMRNDKRSPVDWFDREDRDYKGLMFGKRADYVNSPFG